MPPRSLATVIHRRRLRRQASPSSRSPCLDRPSRLGNSSTTNTHAPLAPKPHRPLPRDRVPRVRRLPRRPPPLRQEKPPRRLLRQGLRIPPVGHRFDAEDPLPPRRHAPQASVIKIFFTTP